MAKKPTQTESYFWERRIAKCRDLLIEALDLLADVEKEIHPFAQRKSRIRGGDPEEMTNEE